MANSWHVRSVSRTYVTPEAAVGADPGQDLGRYVLLQAGVPQHLQTRLEPAKQAGHGEDGQRGGQGQPGDQRCQGEDDQDGGQQRPAGRQRSPTRPPATAPVA